MKAIRYHLSGPASTGDRLALVVREGHRWLTIIPMELAKDGPAIRLKRVRHFDDPLAKPAGTTALVGEVEVLEGGDALAVLAHVRSWAARYGATKGASDALTNMEGAS